MVFLSDEQMCNKIEMNEYTLFDKILCGGLGYGSFCMPTMIFKILFTIIFPPLGILINNLNPDNKTPLLKSFPYITTDHFINIFKKIDEFIIAFILTMLFWLPGLVYVLTKFKAADKEKSLVPLIPSRSRKSTFKNTDDNNTDENTNDKDEDDNTTDKEDEDDDEEEFKNIDLNKLRKELLEHK